MKKIFRILYKPYEWIIFVPLLALSTLIFGSLAIILVFVLKSGTVNLLTSLPWSRFNAFLAPMFVDVTGKENIIKNRSYVVAANHQSLFDILLIIGWLGLDIKWVMKKELRKIFILGLACERLGHLYIDRSNHGSAAALLPKAEKAIKNGSSVFFFPEGTRSRDGQLGEFKKGAFRTAISMNVPILPVTISGTMKILPAFSFNLFPGRVKMIIHKPIDSLEYKNDMETLMNKTKEVIASGLNNLRD